MIEYRRCIEVKLKDVVRMVNLGNKRLFKDADLDEQRFMRVFIGVDGNSLADSFIACDGDKPVGIIIGGAKIRAGVKTIRCSMFYVLPTHRSKGVGQKLYSLFKQNAYHNGCKQMTAEVMSNDRQTGSFLTKQGFRKIYDIKYVFTNNPREIIDQIETNMNYEYRQIDISTIKRVRSEMFPDYHSCWQNEINRIQRSKHVTNWGAYYDDELVGVMCMSDRGGLKLIWVKNNHRNRGVAQSLVKVAYNSFKYDRLNCFFVNGILMERFVEGLKLKESNFKRAEYYVRL